MHEYIKINLIFSLDLPLYQGKNRIFTNKSNQRLGQTLGKSIVSI